MIVALFNVYLAILFVLAKLKVVTVRPVLEGLARTRARLAAVRPVYSDGLGCAAGSRARGTQFGGDRAGCCRRSAGRCQCRPIRR